MACARKAAADQVPAQAPADGLDFGRLIAVVAPPAGHFIEKRDELEQILEPPVRVRAPIVEEIHHLEIEEMPRGCTMMFSVWRSP